MPEAQRRAPKAALRDLKGPTARSLRVLGRRCAAATPYHDLRFDKQAVRSFEAVEALPALPWLFELRGSELFLRVWRTAGRCTAHEVHVVRKASEMEVAFAEMAESIGLYSEGEPGADVPAGCHAPP